jgi:hypothetical protein
MKYPDDQINERLRKALLARLSQIEDQPDPALARIVLASIAPGNRMAQQARWILTALFVLLFSISLYDPKLPARVLSRDASYVPVNPESIYAKGENQPRGGIIPSAQKEILSYRPSANSVVTATADLEKSVTGTFSSSPYNPGAGLAAMDDLKLLESRPAVPFEGIPLPEIESVYQSRRTPALKQRWGLVLGFTPMNTSHLVRINSANHPGYQNFNFPENFSSRKIAWKVQAGAEYKGFQLLLHYARVKQIFEYELATDEFVLDAQKNPLRKGIEKQLDQTLEFAGLGIKKNIDLTAAGLKNYFVNAGLDYSRELTSKQNAFWVTVSAGRQVRLHQNTYLMIGPYAEYSLNRLNTSERGFQLQPYQVGFSFNLKYKIN